MKNILITGAGNLSNNGIYAMVCAARNVISSLDPNSKFIMTSRSPLKDKDIIKKGEVDIEVVEEFWTRYKKSDPRFWWGIIFPLLVALFKVKSRKYRILSAFMQADIVIDLSGDSICSDYSWWSVFYALYNLLIARLYRKKYVLLAQTIGPMDYITLRFFLIYILRHAALIIAREKYTYQFVSELVGEKYLFLGKDIAFFLKPDYSVLDNISKKHNLSFNKCNRIVYVPSIIISRYFKEKISFDQYIDLNVEMIKRILNVFDGEIILIPHVFQDRVACQKIAEHFKCKRVVLMNEDFNAAQYKAIFSKVSCVITHRMHAAVGSVSVNTPVIAWSYNKKFEGVIGSLVGQEYIVNIKKENNQHIMNKTLGNVLNIINHRSSTIKINLTGNISLLKKVLNNG